jgi:mono/diheme cytochrome c family protein
MSRLLQPMRPDLLARAVLALAALGVLVAGAQHARLCHRGYAEVDVVGLLFLLNAIGSLVVVLALVFDRVWIFVPGTVSICLPSLASIAVSHSSIGFLGFREGGYDPDALVIVVAEVAAVVFALVGGAAAMRGGKTGATPAAAGRAPLALIVVAVLGCAIVGIGMGSATAEQAPAPSSAAVAAARERVAAGGAAVGRGRELFADEGCDRCHSIQAIGANGKLGPRLDTVDDDLDDNVESIAQPREDVDDGYPQRLMPADFDERLDDADLRALAAFVTAASGGEDDGGEDDRDGGRGRGRGRSGDGGEG